MRKALWLIAVAMVLAFPLAVLAQQSTTGTLKGVVGDRDGKPLPGATVVVTGPLGERGVQTDENGNFELRFLPTGSYKVRCELAGYATIEISDVTINAGQRTPLPITLLPGQEEKVDVTATPLIDVRRTDIATNFDAKQTTETLPIGRNFTDVVQFAPGVVSGGGTGDGNYSIGGSSGLENSYIIDGVNITDSGYGGVGTYSIVYGSLGTGITSQFLEEVQVKTGGFEPEFGQALGGVVAATIKTGTNDFNGNVSAFVKPASWEAQGNDVSLPTGAINVHERDSQDFGVSAGGPIVKDKLFWYAGYNPVENKNESFVTRVSNPIVEFDPGTIVTYPSASNVFASSGTGKEVKRSNDNYVAKLNWNATPNHRFELTAFGDPSDGDGRSGANAGQFVMTGNVDTNGDQIGDTPIAKTAAFTGNARRSDISYGADQQSLRYNGLFGGEWFLEAQVNHRKNDYTESSAVNDYQYTDNRILREQFFSFPQTITRSVAPTAGGAGFIGSRTDETYDYSVKVTKTWGSNEVKAGIQYFDLEYIQPSIYSGPQFTVFGRTTTGSLFGIKSDSGALVQVRNGIPGCSLCGFSAGNPQYRTTRARLAPSNDPTKGKETSFFIQDTWAINDKWTLKGGVRTSGQKLEGAGVVHIPFTIDPNTGRWDTTLPQTVQPNSFKFKTEWSPRLGVTFDPKANGKTKLYANYARYFERVPADLAVRSFSNELGTTTARYRDPLLTTPNTGIQPNLQGAAPAFVCGQKSFERANGLTHGECTGASRLPYVDEFTIGWQQQLRPDLTIEVRGIYRDQGRILEDTQFSSNEQIINLYYGVDTNEDGNVDYTDQSEVPFPGHVPAPFGAYVLANPGDNTKDVFGTPERKYKAMEVVLTKSLAEHWMFELNYRYSRLRGNYEGLFRNDNGQSDPNITSLYDFPRIGSDGLVSQTMRGQFVPGPINTDRPHVMHLLGGYFFDNGIELGGMINWSSGTPRTPYLAHPNYQNAGEIPGNDPVYVAYDGTGWVVGQRGAPGESFLYDYTDCNRGCLGRTPDQATFDAHFGYRRAIKDMAIHVQLDVNNLFNNQEANAFDDNVELTAGVKDPNFNKLVGYQLPRAIRFGVTFDF